MPCLPCFRPISVLCLVIYCLLPLGARAADVDRVRAAVEPVVASLMSRHEIPGMAVALTVQGRPYVFNFGIASRESGKPVTDGTIFEIGSLSKTLTATLAAYAQTSGKLSLSDHPGRHLPQLRGHPIDQASLLHLGTYTAGGLPLQFPESVQGDDDVFNYYLNWVPIASPGRQREYSNPSIGLFGRAASNALRQDFSSAMETIVFPAFGMSSTFLDVPKRAANDYAWGYRDDKPVRVNPGPMDAEAYGVKTTALDMIRFVQANIDPSALETPMREAVQLTHVALFRAGPLVQGLGWEQYAYPASRERLLSGNAAEIASHAQAAQKLPPNAKAGPRLFNKTGSTGGFGAYALFVPTEHLGIVMLANKNYPIPERIDAALAILEQLSGARSQ